MRLQIFYLLINAAHFQRLNKPIELWLVFLVIRSFILALSDFIQTQKIKIKRFAEVDFIFFFKTRDHY